MQVLRILPAFPLSLLQFVDHLVYTFTAFSIILGMDLCIQNDNKNGGSNTMKKVPRTDKSLRLKVSTLEAENEQLYQIIEQLNTTLQKLITVYIKPKQ